MTNELTHHGIRGQKWGKRRFQYNDGSLTPAGEKRYYDGDGGSSGGKSAAKAKRKAEIDTAKNAYKQAKKTEKTKEKELLKKYGELEDQMTYGKNADSKKNAAIQKQLDKLDREMSENKRATKNAKNEYKKAKELTPEEKKERTKKVAVAGATVAAVAVATYGAYKLNKYVKTKNCEIAAKAGRDYAEKMFNAELDGLTKGPGKITSGVLRSNSGYKALEEASRASNDSFAKALKNVAAYKRSGNDLSALNSLSSYANFLEGSKIKFG